MFNESGGGNLGSASGSIIINTESIEAAVKVAQAAAAAISSSMAQIDAAQNKVGVKSARAQTAEQIALAVEQAAQREVVALQKQQAAEDLHQIQLTRLAAVQIDLEQKKQQATEAADAVYQKSANLRISSVQKQTEESNRAIQAESQNQAKYLSMLEDRLDKEAVAAATSIRLAEEVAAKQAAKNAAKAETAFDKTAVPTGSGLISGGTPQDIINQRLAQEAELIDHLTIVSRNSSSLRIQDELAVKAAVDALTASMDQQRGIKINGGFDVGTNALKNQVAIGSWPTRIPSATTTSSEEELSRRSIEASNEETQVVINNESQKQRAYKATDALRDASFWARINQGTLNVPDATGRTSGIVNGQDAYDSRMAAWGKDGQVSIGEQVESGRAAQAMISMLEVEKASYMDISAESTMAAEAQIAASEAAAQVELNNVKMLQEAFASVGQTIPSVARSIADAQIASSNTATQVELDNVAALTAAWQSAARQRPGTFGLPPSQGGAAGAGGNGGAGGGDPLIDESGQFAKPDDGSGGAGLTGSGSGTRVPFGMRASRALIPFGFLANQLGAGDLAKIIFTAQASLSLVEFIPKLGASFTQLGAQLLAMNGAIGDATNFVVRMVAARATALTAEDAEIITKNTLTAATLAGATAEEAQAAAEAALTEATLAAASGATITSAAIATVFLPIIAVIATIVIAAKLLTDAYNEQKIAAEATAKAISDRTENIKSAVQIGLQGDPGQARAGLSAAQSNYLTAQDTQFQLQKQLNYYKSDQFRLDDAARGKSTVQIAIDATAYQNTYTDAVKKAGEATEAAREAVVQYTLAQKAAAEVAKFNVPEKQFELKSSLTNTSSLDVSQQITDNENKITLARIAQIEATKESNRAAQESVLATDQQSRDQADALSRTTKAYAEQQGAIVDDTTALNTWLTNILPTIKAREAETKAIENANQALQKSIDLNKLLVDAANSGNPDDVRKTIADLTNQRQEAQDITLPTYQNRINAANARLGAQSRASGTPVAQLQANDAEYQDAYKGLTATNESIKTFTGEIDHLNTAGIRGATIIQQLGLEEAKILAIRQNVATSSRDLQSGLANDQQDIDVANRAEFAAKNDLYLATKEGRVADIEAARSKIQVYEATKTNAQADIDLLSGLIAIAQARESETRSIDEQRAAIQHNIQYSKDLAQQIRTATAEQAADTLQQNKEATRALKDNLPALEAWRNATKAAADNLDAARIRNDPNLGKIEALAAQANDAAKQFEDAKIQLGQLGVQATDTLTKVVPAAIERATTDFINDVIQMRIDSQQKVADINAKEQEDEANALKKYNDDVAEADKKTKEQALKDQKDFNDRRAKIEEQYRLDFSNAVGDRDALAALKAREKRDKDLNDLTKDYNDQKKELAKALKDQKDVARKHYEESLEQAKDNAAKSLAAEQRRLRDEIAARAAAYQKQLSDLVALGVGGAKILSDMAINGIDSLSVLGNSAALIFANMAANARAAVDASNVPPNTNYGGSGLGTYKPTRYSTGTPYLSQDEIAQLHGGEGVINEAANAVVRQYLGNNYSQSDLAMAVMNGKSGGSSGSGMGTQIAFKMGNISIVATDASEIKRQATGVFHTQLDKALKAAGIK